VDQENGAPASAVTQAARTVLPGEPFDPPTSAQVPGPRQDERQPVPPPVAHWNYPPPEQAYGAPAYQDAPVAGMQFVDQTQPAPPAYQVDAPAEAGDFSSLHEYASLPAAQPQQAPQGFPPPPQGFAPADYPQSQPESTWPPAAPLNQQYGPGQIPTQNAPLPPLPPPPLEDDLSADSGHRRTGRRSIDKRLLAVIGVVVVAGGGYLAYSHFSKSSSSSSASAPIVPATAPAAPKYDFPANAAGFKLQPAASSAQERTAALAQLKQFSPVAATSMSFASYSAGHPEIIALTFRTPAATIATTYTKFVAFVAKPDKGNVAVRPHSAIPGAAGGTMVCGGQSGNNTQSWCVWHNKNTVGLTVIEGTPKTQINEIVTREMRAFAEH
jgi:hypothetical protein